jgi:predicted PurR-regulated permease PerM
MATTSPQLARQHTPALLPAIARLAWWRFKRMWLVLLVTWLGMLTMVMLVCAVPLFSQVAMTAGVRNALNSAPPYDQRITFTLASAQPTTVQIHQAEQSIAQVVNDNLASYTNGAAHFSVQVPALTITSGGTTAAGSNTTRLLSLFSYTLDQIANEITVVQGRLPQAGSDQVEIALTQNTAQSLGKLNLRDISLKRAFTRCLAEEDRALSATFPWKPIVSSRFLHPAGRGTRSWTATGTMIMLK